MNRFRIEMPVDPRPLHWACRAHCEGSLKNSPCNLKTRLRTENVLCRPIPYTVASRQVAFPKKNGPLSRKSPFEQVNGSEADDGKSGQRDGSRSVTTPASRSHGVPRKRQILTFVCLVRTHSTFRENTPKTPREGVSLREGV